jgi:hypothetical protein
LKEKYKKCKSAKEDLYSENLKKYNDFQKMVIQNHRYETAINKLREELSNKNEHIKQLMMTFNS